MAVLHSSHKASLAAPVKLLCAVQNYDWGILARDDSLVATLHKANNGAASIDGDKPYAELWMGTHSSGPSFVESSKENGAANVSLKEHLGNNDLPFLLKVLSVRKALSIQAHPDIDLAKKLHANSPTNYRDSNHKPEMAIALTPFEALCGFRPLEEIAAFIQAIPELIQLVGPAPCEQLVMACASGKEDSVRKEALRSFFSALMKCNGGIVAENTAELLERLAGSSAAIFDDTDSILAKSAALFVRLNAQFPNDIGCFCVFVLNYINMDPGQAIFLAANEPHAYLSGNCVEVMATSDNVVRAGLTPKFRDVETLCSMLTYRTFRQDELFEAAQEIAERPFAQLFAPQVKEFAIIRSHLSAPGLSDTSTGLEGRSILLCVTGAASLDLGNGGLIELLPGAILFIPSKLSFTLTSKAPNTTLFQAFEPL